MLLKNRTVTVKQQWYFMAWQYNFDCIKEFSIAFLRLSVKKVFVLFWLSILLFKCGFLVKIINDEKLWTSVDMKVVKIYFICSFVNKFYQFKLSWLFCRKRMAHSRYNSNIAFLVVSNYSFWGGGGRKFKQWLKEVENMR